MKFLLLTMGIRVVIEIFINKRNDANAGKAGVVNKTVRHPAEFELR